jgi:hypothetical protein
MKKIITPISKQTTSASSPSRRLTHSETAVAIGGTLGDLVKIRHGGPKTRDPSFPPMVNQTFDVTAVDMWVKNRDSLQSAPVSTPPVTAHAPQRERRETTDRRKPRA